VAILATSRSPECCKRWEQQPTFARADYGARLRRASCRLATDSAAGAHVVERPAREDHRLALLASGRLRRWIRRYPDAANPAAAYVADACDVRRNGQAGEQIEQLVLLDGFAFLGAGAPFRPRPGVEPVQSEDSRLEFLVFLAELGKLARNDARRGRDQRWLAGRWGGLRLALALPRDLLVFVAAPCCGRFGLLAQALGLARGSFFPLAFFFGALPGRALFLLL
jgi:hypothetical protein